MDIAELFYNLIKFWVGLSTVPDSCPSSIGLQDFCQLNSCKECKIQALINLPVD